MEKKIFSKHDLKKDLLNLGIKKDDILLVHSSMKSIGNVEGGADTVIDVFMEYITDGLLIFPTHTWKQINENYNIFDPKKEPSCVGILSNIFLKRKNVFRSLHPTHSIAAYGKNSEDFVKGEEVFDTPLNRNGCWGKIYDLKSKILFIGCNLNTNTIIHGVEEWCGIPNRLSDKYQNLKIKIDDKLIERPIRRHHNDHGDVSENYGKIEKPLLKLGIAKIGKFGDAKTYIIDSYKMINLVIEFLKKDPDLFLTDKPIPENWY